jgi:uncharacterized protein (DUF1778 family)
MTPRTGRPKSEHPRSNIIPVRFSDDEVALIKWAADRAEITVGQYIRDKAYAAAKRQR